MSDVFNKQSLLNDLRRLKNELAITPNDESLKAEIRKIEDLLNNEGNKEPAVMNDEPFSVMEEEGIIEDNIENNIEDEEDKKEEVLEKVVAKPTKKPKTNKKAKNKNKDEEEDKKRDTGASVRGIPQVLMSKIRSKVPFATNNKDAIVCFLAYILEDYEYLSEDQKEIVNNIDNEDPLSSISTRLNTIRDRQIEMEESLNIAMIATAFLSLRNMGLETNSYRNFNDIENKLLSSDLEDFIETLKKINKGYRVKKMQSESSDIHINRR